MNIRQRKAERHKETLRKLSQEGGNRYCFDCNMRGPLYVVSDFNILVCSGCSAVHRSFQHKVKGITMSEFTEEEIARFTLGGNDTAEKIWLSAFKSKHPRSGDVLALKDFIRDVFVDRRCCDQIAYARLMKAWEDPQASLVAASSTPLTTATVTATSLPPPPAAAKPAAEPVRESSPPANTQPVPASSAIDDLFSMPVQAPVMQPPPPQPPSTSTSAAVAPPPPPPQTISSLVDDLFGGAPAPALVASGPTSGYSSQPQPFAGFGGPSYPPTSVPQQGPSYVNSSSNAYAGQTFSSGAPTPQQQQQLLDFNAPQPQPTFGNPQNIYGNGNGNAAAYMATMPPQPQQCPGYNAPFNAPPMPNQAQPTAQPFFSGPSQPQQQPQQPHVTNFSAPPPTHATHANDPFRNLGDPSIFSHLGSGAPTGASQRASGSQQNPSHPTPPQNALSNAPNSWGQPSPSQAQPFVWGQPMPQQQQQQPHASQINFMGALPSSSSAAPSGGPQGIEQGQGWGCPASTASSSSNRNRIVVLSVTKPNEPPSDAPSLWQCDSRKD